MKKPRRRRHWPLVLAALCGPTSLARAAGPADPAGVERTAWPETLGTATGFDAASRFEILTFAQALGEADLTAAGLHASVGVDPGADQAKGAAMLASVERWRTQTLKVLVANFVAASATCKGPSDVELCNPAVQSPAELAAMAAGFALRLGAVRKPWYEQAKEFHGRYLREQLRLAALFPKITSEILQLDTSEVTGLGLPDKSFLLTFDDGPTAVGGTTDATLKMLAELHLNGYFFALGDQLEARLKQTPPTTLKALYQGQCLASHGQKHNSHAKMVTWRDSLRSTAATIRRILGDDKAPVSWRPPYGQRRPEAAAFVKAQLGGRLILWNIDSQDWHHKMNPVTMRGRVVTLMLLWRRGILLFHDVHDKVQKTLPLVVKDTEGSGLRWAACADAPLGDL
jgi:peptidoglycan/xylan/chitin deacetylase (PgdA/CDA1 family)